MSGPEMKHRTWWLVFCLLLAATAIGSMFVGLGWVDSWSDLACAEERAVCEASNG